MLKPKRKISKQEIKKDPFLEFINSAQQWLQINKKVLYQIAFGIVAVILIIYFVSNRRGNSTIESEGLLGKALLAQDMGDLENAKFQLQTLVDDFNGTQAGIEGNYYLGNLAFDGNEIEQAEEYYSNYVAKAKNPILLTTAYKSLAEIALSNDNVILAEKLLKKGSSAAENTVYHDEMLLLLADRQIKNGDIDNAKKIVDKILDKENLLFSVKKAAEELLGRIGG